MAAATSTAISDVDPTGGGDYTTLAAWWTATKGGGGGANVAPHARCYSGGDLGVVNVDGASFTPTAVYYVHIYPASGERHDGTQDGTQGARIEQSSAHGITDPATTGQNYLRVEGIRIIMNNTIAGGAAIWCTERDNLLLDGNLIDIAATSAQYRGIVCNARLDAGVGTRTLTLRNNLIYGTDFSGQDGDGIQFNVVCNGTSLTASMSLHNNSLSKIGSHADTDGIGIAVKATAGKTAIGNYNLRNNIVTGTPENYAAAVVGAGGAETLNMNVANCLSEDGTADDWGGAGNLVSKPGDEVFVDEDTDLHLIGVAYDTSSNPTWGWATYVGADLSGTFTTDALGNTRTVPFDMGALMFVAGYRLYRGTVNLYDVDFSTVVAAVPGGVTSESFVGLEHSVSTQYFYVLRPVRNSLETPDISCFVEMLTDAAGDWEGSRPDPVLYADGEVLSGGQIKLRWNYSLGSTTPTSFGIWYGSTPDVDTSGAPSQTVTYTSPKIYKHTFTLTDGVAYWFAVKARSATNESNVVITGPYLADSTAPDAPSLTTDTSF